MPAIEQGYEQIIDFARAHHVRRVVLFGSRACGDALSRSDIDLAVEGCDDFTAFEEDVQDRLWSLLEVDLIDLDGPISPQLAADIARDGRVLYEKV